jgi:uncharacterized membrane protein YccC
MPPLPTLPLPIRRFLLGQQLFWGLRVTLGACLPALALLAIGCDISTAVEAGIGALYVGLLDLPGTQRQRHHTLLTAALLLIAATLLASLLMRNDAGMWLTMFAISAIGGYAQNFGARAASMGLNGVLALTLALSLRHAPPMATWHYLAALSAGALFYVYCSLAVCALLRYRLHRCALAETLFALAAQYRARARCYDPGEDERQALQALVECRRQQHERFLAARDLVLGELSAEHDRPPSSLQLRLFNLFADCVTLYDLVLGAHTDFTLLRQHAACQPLLVALRARLEQGAAALEEIASALSLDRPPRRAVHLHGQPAALAPLLAHCRSALPDEVAAALDDSIARLEAMRRRVAHTARDLRSHGNTSGLDLTQVLAHYPHTTPLFSRPPRSEWFDGPAFSYALRLSLAVLAALYAVGLRHDPHSYWIVLTVAVSLRPGFGQSRQRGLKRVAGTILGCFAALPAIALSANGYWLLSLALLSLTLCLALAAMDYLASSFFGAMLAVIVYHLMAPASHIVAARMIDTAIGGAIAWTMAQVFPYWESRRIRPRCRALGAALARYLQQLATLAEASASDIAFSAARREARAALEALGTSIDSMRQEPPRTRLDTPALPALLALADQLLALGESAASMLRQADEPALRQNCRLAQHILTSPSAVDMPPAQAAVSLPECAFYLRAALADVMAARRPRRRTWWG